jgi:hypothetical protein
MELVAIQAVLSYLQRESCDVSYAMSELADWIPDTSIINGHLFENWSYARISVQLHYPPSNLTSNECALHTDYLLSTLTFITIIEFLQLQSAIISLLREKFTLH